MSFVAISSNAQYTMPIETAEHEGTWLQWPHNNLYGPYYRDDLNATWIEMTRELVKGENVHIIAYDANEQAFITQSLTNAGVSLDNVDFVIRPNDDCWVRDNGPIFVYNEENEMVLLDWGFNGWGGDTPYQLCNTVPDAISAELNMPKIDLNTMIIEGGAFEIDGNGTLLATKSSILEDDRNPNLTQAQVETYLTENIGVTNFIWLDGVSGLDITDMHIDGFARFHDAETLVCMNDSDLTYWEVPAADRAILLNATNIDGITYNKVFLPLTQNNVVTTWGENLGIKGSYVNYYVGNAVVLVPTYNDPKDEDAIAILEDLYPNREVVGIDVRNLYSGGGMIHCVTQQQPIALELLPVGLTDFISEEEDCIVTLNWTTYFEKNNRKFLIERSEDRRYFSTIGEIQGKGNSTERINYTFVDENPAQVNYYRLRQIDFDGTENIHQIITAENSCETTLIISLSSNLTSNNLKMKAENGVNDKLQMQMFDLTGKRVDSFLVPHTNELSEFNYDVSHLQAGLYFIHTSSTKNQFNETLSFVVSR